MADEAQTKPTLDTLLERINALGTQLNEEMHAARQHMNGRFDALETRLERLETRFNGLEAGVNVRLDRIEGEVKATHSELFILRADFTEFKAQFKQPA